ncbi:MAG: glycosyltransferase family 39 protein [Planctomycetes bacterium]|nr:glycosyltransferase family 39 protein [Planctomycetota bacterium]
MTHPTQTNISSRHFDRGTILILIAIAAWMIWAAGYYTVFDDEAFSCQRYVLPMGEMLRALWDGVEPDPPLYYMLQNLSVRVVGVGPLGLRALSIVVFLAGLMAMRAAGRAWFDERVGRLTMLLCAVHPAHLFFGFAARWYSTMFFMVALLLCTTKALADVQATTPALHRRERRLVFFWALAAAGVCYTNYFGPVVVGLIWIVSIARHSCRMRWLGAGVIAAALFAPWWPPYWRQVTAFPQFDGGAMSMAATAGRTMMALCAGNLASPRAWWVWGPMAVFGVLFVARAWQKRSRVWPVGVIVIGCFIAGAVSRTMIDKYVMTFSGVACLLVAAVLCRESGSHRLETCVTEHRLETGATGTIRLAACTTLVLAWLGCGANLVMEKNWSSLRWLDPIEQVVRRCMREWGPPDGALWIASHPSVHYYRGALCASPVKIALRVKTDEDRATLREFTSTQSLRYVFAGEWLAMRTWDTSASKHHDGLHYPELSLIETSKPRRVVTIETTGYSESREWDAVRMGLDHSYRLVADENNLLDPDAEWKDRIDPRFKHPRWRITVRVWERAKPG